MADRDEGVLRSRKCTFGTPGPRGCYRPDPSSRQRDLATNPDLVRKHGEKMRGAVKLDWIVTKSRKHMQDSSPTYHAQCYCGAVKLQAEGKPLLQGYCHCSTCRQRSAAPMIGYTIWSEASVKITDGPDLLNRFPQPDRPEASKWMSCQVCGCAIGTHITTRGMIDILIGAFRDFPFQPQAHLNYGDAIIRMADGLPKYRNMPGQSGGSDELMPE